MTSGSWAKGLRRWSTVRCLRSQTKPVGSASLMLAYVYDVGLCRCLVVYKGIALAVRQAVIVAVLALRSQIAEAAARTGGEAVRGCCGKESSRGCTRFSAFQCLWMAAMELSMRGMSNERQSLLVDRLATLILVGRVGCSAGGVAGVAYMFGLMPVVCGVFCGCWGGPLVF